MNKKMMKTKGLCLGLFVILMLSLLQISVFASLTPDEAAIKVSLVNQDPDPASPGDYVTVKFRIENEGQSAVSNFKTELGETFPFTLDPGVDSVIDIGSVGALQKSDLGVIVEYKVRVASNAVEGSNTLNLKYSYDKTETQVAEHEAEFEIEVKTQDSGLAIKSVDVEGGKLEQGRKGMLNIILENPSDSTLRDVTVKLDLSSDDLSFAPSGSATEIKQKFLTSGKEASFDFGLIPYPAAASGVYKIPVTITYYDSSNEFVEKESLVGVVVGSEPDMVIVVDSDGFVSESETGEVTISFINKGLTDIKFLYVSLEDTEEYEVYSVREDYVGGVESDDYEKVDFKILRKNISGKDSFNLNLKVQYKDANNDDYSFEKIIPVKLQSSALTGGKQSGGSSNIVIIVVLVGVGYYIYRRRKNSKKK